MARSATPKRPDESKGQLARGRAKHNWRTHNWRIRLISWNVSGWSGSLIKESSPSCLGEIGRPHPVPLCCLLKGKPHVERRYLVEHGSHDLHSYR